MYTPKNVYCLIFDQAFKCSDALTISVQALCISMCKNYIWEPVEGTIVDVWNIVTPMMHNDVMLHLLFVYTALNWESLSAVLVFEAEQSYSRIVSWGCGWIMRQKYLKNYSYTQHMSYMCKKYLWWCIHKWLVKISMHILQMHFCPNYL